MRGISDHQDFFVLLLCLWPCRIAKRIANRLAIVDGRRKLPNFSQTLSQLIQSNDSCCVQETVFTGACLYDLVNHWVGIIFLLSLRQRFNKIVLAVCIINLLFDSILSRNLWPLACAKGSCLRVWQDVRNAAIKIDAWPNIIIKVNVGCVDSFFLVDLESFSAKRLPALMLSDCFLGPSLFFECGQDIPLLAGKFE